MTRDTLLALLATVALAGVGWALSDSVFEGIPDRVQMRIPD